MTTEPTIESTSVSDADLIESVRAQDSSAYAVLFERHRVSALKLARSLTHDQADADDLVSEAFTRVYAQLIAGKGPTEAFRAYLLTAIRRLHVDRIRSNQRERPTEDDKLDRPTAFVDTAELGFERTTTAEAFASLPERWQMVLWHLDVEGEKPAEVAELLQMSPNSVSALAYRAREGLRQAYLQAHLTPATDKACADVTTKLGAHVRGGLSGRQSAKVDSHLRDCRSCMGLYLELEEFNSSLGAILGPAVLGTAAFGYLGAGAVLGAGATVFGAASGGAGGAGGGAGASGGAGGAGPATAAVAAAAAVAVAAAGVAAVASGLVSPGHRTSTSGSPPAAAAPAAPHAPTATAQKPAKSAKTPPAAAPVVTQPALAPTTLSPTTPAPTTPAPSTPTPSTPAPTTPTTPAPTTVSPTPSPSPTPTPSPPPSYDASVQGISFTNLAEPLSRQMSITLGAANTQGRAHTISVTINFTTAMTLEGSSGWTSCASSGSVTSLTCTVTTSGADTSPSIDITGAFPNGTVSIESTSDSNAANNQLSFSAQPWEPASQD